MANGGGDKEPKEAKYRPDGLKGSKSKTATKTLKFRQILIRFQRFDFIFMQILRSYYPRVIFLKPDGSRIDSVKGKNKIK